MKWVAWVNREGISADFLSFIKKEGLIREKRISKVLDGIIKDYLLSTEAERLKLDKSPDVKERLGREEDHVYVTFALKSTYPKITLREIRRNYNALSERLFESIMERARIEYEDISCARAIIDTENGKEKREEIVVATANDEKVTVQDVLDRFPAYKEQMFFEWDEEYRKDVVLQAIQMKLIKKRVTPKKYPVLDEYLKRIKQNILANAVRALYLDLNSEFFRSETSDEFLRIEMPKPDVKDLKDYYKQNPEKFKIADRIKVRHIAVERKEDMDRILSQIEENEVGANEVRTDEDFMEFVGRYSLTNEGDSDLITIHNPILNPESEIPSYIPWPLARIVLFDLEKCRVSPLFKSKENFHVLYVLDKEVKIVPFSNNWAKQTCLRCWRNEQRKNALSDLIERLEAHASIKINEKVLRNIQRWRMEE